MQMREEGVEGIVTTTRKRVPVVVTFGASCLGRVWPTVQWSIPSVRALYAISAGESGG